MQVINLKYPVASGQIPDGPIVLALGFLTAFTADISKSLQRPGKLLRPNTPNWQ
jgi:hypothetical protein